LEVPDARRAADYFWGMLLHQHTLQRLYNVAPSPKAAAVRSACTAAVEAFMALYQAPRGAAVR
jgi:hypothetical protein